jgi:hypothetical protein
MGRVRSRMQCNLVLLHAHNVQPRPCWCIPKTAAGEAIQASMHKLYKGVILRQAIKCKAKYRKRDMRHR